MTTIEQQPEVQRPRAFHPNEHLITLKSKQGDQEYLEVKWRLVWFRERYPHGTIDTEAITIDLDYPVEGKEWDNHTKSYKKVIKKGFAFFKAVVEDGEGGRGTGHKSEHAGSFDDFIEKAETGALGRALAALGYGTQFAPELNEEQRLVDAPVASEPRAPEPPRSTTPTPQRSSTPPQASKPATTAPANQTATPGQIASLTNQYKLLRREPKVNLADLSYEEATNLIRQLSKEIQQARDVKKFKAS